MIERKVRTALPVLVVITAALGGCVNQPSPPGIIGPAFDASQIDTIHLMPVKAFVPYSLPDLDDWVWKGTKVHLKRKHYECIPLRDRSLVDRLTGDDIRKANPEVLGKVGPPGAEYALFFALTQRLESPKRLGELTRYVPPGTLAWRTIQNSDLYPVFKLSAHLFDRRRRELIWSNSNEFLLGGYYNEAQGKFIWSDFDVRMIADNLLWAAARNVQKFPSKR